MPKISEIKLKLSLASWVCNDCGQKYGEPREIATWHYGHCDVCNKNDIAVTEPRDFNYFHKTIDK